MDKFLSKLTSISFNNTEKDRVEHVNFVGNKANNSYDENKLRLQRVYIKENIIIYKTTNNCYELNQSMIRTAP